MSVWSTISSLSISSPDSADPTEERVELPLPGADVGSELEVAPPGEAGDAAGLGSKPPTPHPQ